MDNMYQKKRWLETLIVSIALVFSSFIYIAVCYFIRAFTVGPNDFEKFGFAGKETDFSNLVMIFWIVGIIAVLISIYLKKNTIKALEEGQSGHNELINFYAQRILIGITLAEIIGILGLVLCLLSGDFKNLLLMNLVSVLAKINHFPKKKYFEFE